MRANQNNEVYNNAMKVAKRIAITIVCCLPVLILFSYFMRNIIKSDALMITIFVLFFGLAIFIEELIVRKMEKRKQSIEKIKPKRDVFK